MRRSKDERKKSEMGTDPGGATDLVNVTASTFCFDTGADGQFTPSSVAPSRSPQTANAPQGQWRAEMRCCIVTKSTVASQILVG